MSLIKIDVFGGELPSVSPRALPAEAAQENRNLHLALAEFRPLATDAAAGSATNGAQTLYRFNGGWRSDTKLVSYVKGQINDEKTERTYFTTDDGSATPRAIDNKGANRELGVYRPAKPAVTLQVADEITPEEASTFLYGEVAEKVRKAVKDALIDPEAVTEPQARHKGGVPLAGPYSNNNLTLSSRDGHNLSAVLTQARMTALKGIDPAKIRAQQVGSQWWVPLQCLPFAIGLDAAKLRSQLAAIKYPKGFAQKTGAQVLSSGQINELVADIDATLNANKLAKSERDELDALAQEFYRLLVSQSIPTPPTRPKEPVKPTVPEFPTPPTRPDNNSYA